MNVTSIHSLVILVLAYYYACNISGKDFKDVLNMSEVAEILAKIFDTITNDKIELYLHRLLTLNAWNQETGTTVSIIAHNVLGEILNPRISRVRDTLFFGL